MTGFAQKFPLALAVFAFGVTGFMAMAYGVGAVTSVMRAFAAGFVFFVLGKLIAVALFYEPLHLPEKGVRYKPGSPENVSKDVKNDKAPAPKSP